MLRRVYGGVPRAKSTVFWTPRRLDRESNFTSYKLVLYDCNCIVVLQITDVRTTRISRSAGGFWSDLRAVYGARTALNELC